MKNPALENAADAAGPLPARFGNWFAQRGWQLRAHQRELTELGLAGYSALLIAPTGGGKTLAGFLASLIELSQEGTHPGGIHTLYISPLKALAVDVRRNLEIPIEEMGLDIRLETRTGDTPQNRRQRQRRDPPDILMTTPEQLALLLSYEDAARLFSSLQCVVLDELHALANTKRGDLLSLGLARLSALAPSMRRIGLSATVAEPDQLRRYLVPQVEGEERLSALVKGEGGAVPEIGILTPEVRIPWSGHSARHALPAIYEEIRKNKTVLIFVNTRSQAEFIFRDLWYINEDNLPIALHHGSLSTEQRRKVEAAMAAGSLRAVVCTSTLDLGIDWGDVDLVLNVGAPKGSSRLLQRIGRANHRLSDPSRALLVPANRFEVLECEAARAAALAGIHDGMVPKRGALDVLAQHIMGMACSAPFDADELYGEVRSAAPYAHLTRARFDKVLSFVETGGYALRTYDRYRRLRPNNIFKQDRRYRLAHPRLAQQYRMNVGTIVEAPMLKVRLVRRRPNSGAPVRGGRVLGEIEEYFIEQLVPGDTFLFAGKILRFEGLVETEAYVTSSKSENPAIPSYAGGKFPLSTYLAEEVRRMLSQPASWKHLPDQVSEWLRIQEWRSELPGLNDLLAETFPRNDKFYFICYPFEGRLAHQTLGMLLTRRLERAGARPLGFVASEYSLAIWCLRDVGMMAERGDLSLAALFDEDMLGDDLENWLAESNLMKRTFRNCAVISGLIERRFPGKEKSGRQVTFSSDLIYDVLREHEPDHILLEATWEDAAAGFLDVARVAAMLGRIKGRIRLKRLDRVSPLAVPALLDIGKEPVYGEASEALLAEAADDLIEEATRLV
ncbi:DEAD/DEAH box helicase domain-containing protein [Tepidicaulis marinus]|uniref:DEAD/DEAH box helicase domain-containing protein n=1 Tax=Tepidicaulis marinus TaxID=1333998 RepID=A0A081BC16_9HYPH|nr:ligase-associated DNA damage response DEXH box helicase [Tepidicaulis marinus]GAK45584.1 DEAD/DEAH box helicase domain-containing protein [Tepidicaulis marinus]